jgi:RNA polymerase sigma-70 factor, ECF subfamily
MPLVDVHDRTAPLVAAAASGDREAFRELVEQAWAPLVRLARSVVGDGEAEDAVQEALIVAWRRLGDLREPERFDPWARRIVFRQCLRRVRRGRWRRSREQEAAPAPVVRQASDETIPVWDVLRRLPPKQRAVLHMTIVEGMTDSEIAGVLRIMASSVRAHRRRARESTEAFLRTHQPRADRKT